MILKSPLTTPPHEFKSALQLQSSNMGFCQTDSVTYVRKPCIVLSAKVRVQKQLWLNI